MTKEEFIRKANKIYNQQYEYRCVPNHELENYSNVPIICDKHGLFFQSVYDHLDGKGCFECYKEKRDLTEKNNLSNFNNF